MKAVLSHFHAKQNTKHELNNVYYLLILPMLHIMAPYLSKYVPNIALPQFPLGCLVTGTRSL